MLDVVGGGDNVSIGLVLNIYYNGLFFVCLCVKLVVFCILFYGCDIVKMNWCVVLVGDD